MEILSNEKVSNETVTNVKYFTNEKVSNENVTLIKRFTNEN